jgi:hypothetical protein
VKAAEQQVIPGAEQFEKPEDSMTAIVKRCILDPSFDANKLSVLLDAQLKWEANEARKKFEAAFEQFKRHLPEIFKTKDVQAGQMRYSHAELDKITPIITDALLAVGIVHHWRPSDNGGKISVTCVFKGFGHTEDMATLCGPPDTTGGKGNVQAIGSTKTYLERYTLLAACGIAARGMDDDGKTEGLPEDTVLDYCAALKDASDWESLRTICKEAVEKANNSKDTSAKERFRKLFEERKRDLRSQQ